jgi:hypothetical protein
MSRVHIAATQHRDAYGVEEASTVGGVFFSVYTFKSSPWPGNDVPGGGPGGGTVTMTW